MAFNLNLVTDSSALCDKCKKAASDMDPLVDMWTTGRSSDQRNFIQIHKRCLNRAIRKEEQPSEFAERNQEASHA